MTDRLQTHLAARLNAAQTGGDHPEPETLTAFRERKLTSRSRETVADHLSRCAACREVLALSGTDRPRFRRPYAVSLAAAAAIVVVLAASTSTMDTGIVLSHLSELQRKVHMLSGEHAPQFAYAVAELKPPAVPVDWRIRNSVLEYSVDLGKNWRPAKLDKPFEPLAVQHSGSDVWVRSRSGEVALSRDAGMHWTFLKSAKER